MKKRIHKLRLNKWTVSNLGVPEMNKVGGNPTNGRKCTQTNGNHCTDTCIWCCTGHQCSYPGGCTGICTV